MASERESESLADKKFQAGATKAATDRSINRDQIYRLRGFAGVFMSGEDNNGAVHNVGQQPPVLDLTLSLGSINYVRRLPAEEAPPSPPPLPRDIGQPTMVNNNVNATVNTIVNNNLHPGRIVVQRIQTDLVDPVYPPPEFEAPAIEPPTMVNRQVNATVNNNLRIEPGRVDPVVPHVVEVPAIERPILVSRQVNGTVNDMVNNSLNLQIGVQRIEPGRFDGIVPGPESEVPAIEPPTMFNNNVNGQVNGTVNVMVNDVNLQTLVVPPPEVEVPVARMMVNDGNLLRSPRAQAVRVNPRPVHAPPEVEVEVPVADEAPPRQALAGVRRANRPERLSRPPYEWATVYRGKVLSIRDLAQRGITEVSGDVQCKQCEQRSQVSFNISEKFNQIGRYAAESHILMQERAPVRWSNPALPRCAACGHENSLKPVIDDKKKNINWLFLFLGEMVGCCSLDQLKYFCKHTDNHRTGSKNRLLYLTYLELCRQLDPTGPFWRLEQMILNR